MSDRSKVIDDALEPTIEKINGALNRIILYTAELDRDRERIRGERDRLRQSIRNLDANDRPDSAIEQDDFYDIQPGDMTNP